MPTLINNITLIDGTGAPALPDAAVLIEDGRIARTGPAVSIAAPEGVETIDGAGLWAVPGLIDTHLHTELVGREALPVMLALGLTTVRDLGGGLEFLVETRRQLDAGGTGPRFLFTGPMVDGDPPTFPALVQPTQGIESAVGFCDECLNAGADAIKLYTMLPPESLRACIQHVDGRVPVTGHLGMTLASEAIEAGIDGLEHALLTPYNDFAPEEMRTAAGEGMMSPGFWPKVQDGWLEADLTSDKAKRWIERLVAQDVSFCPTLTVCPGTGEEPDEEELRNLPLVAERWEESKRMRESQALPPAFREKALRVRARLQELVGLAHDAGGRVVAGTDSGAIRSIVPGYALHFELSLLVGAGLSNMEALRAATARAAEALRRDDLGTIEAGKRADLLLLRGDPLADIAALKEIERVVQDGVVYEPAALLGGA